MKKHTYIYALKDPRDGSVRYVGKANKPRYRLAQHLADKTNNAMRIAWINELQLNGLSPILEILERVPLNLWQNAEKHWISTGHLHGWPLTNAVGGGGGLTEKPVYALDFGFVQPYIELTLWEKYCSMPDLLKLLIASLIVQASLVESEVARDVGFITKWSPQRQYDRAREMATKLISAEREDCYKLIVEEKRRAWKFDVKLYRWSGVDA